MNATLLTKAGAAASAVCLLLFSASRVDAQPPAASIAINGGVATDQRGVQSNALTLAPDLRFDGDRAALQLGGSATRFADDLWSLGGGAALALRNPVGRFAALTLNASGNMSRLGGSFDATYTEAAIVPALEVTLGRLALFGGARAALGSATTPSFTPSPLPFSGPRSSSSSVSRDGAGPIFGAAFALSSPGALRLAARQDRMSVAGVVVTDRSLSLSASSDAMRFGVAAGQRGAADEKVAFGSASLSIDVTLNAALELAAGSYPRNRLLETPGGRFVNAGLSLRVGSARERSLPEPSGVRRAASGVTRLSIRAADATRVEVAGDFNEWKPAPATKAGNGVWYVDLRIAPGQYRYAFRVNGREWRVPDGATAVDDGFGGKSAWITVRDAPAR